MGAMPWRLVLFRIFTRDSFAAYRGLFCQYLVRRWDQGAGKRDPLLSVELFYMNGLTVPYYPTVYRPRRLFRYRP